MDDPAVTDVVWGRCVGGPLDGQDVAVRSGDGFLATDRARGRAWVYAHQGDGRFTVCLDHDDSLVYPRGAETGERRLDEQRLWQAGESSALDIVAVDAS